MTLSELISTAIEWVYGFWPFRIVHAWEQGIRLRCGKIVTTLEPGVHSFWPLVGEIITRDSVLDVNTTDSQTVDTLDGETVTFSLAFKYRIADLAALYSKIQDHDDTVANEVCSSAASLVGTFTYEDLMTELPDAVWKDVHGRLAEWGIELFEVTLFNLCAARTYRLIMGD
jgi:regulator of protease activity HflC (stomatin/prohibitin superfamily)